jgi:hypothetical protein
MKTFEEFMDVIKGLEVNIQPYNYDKPIPKNRPLETPFISVKWSTGGMHGGGYGQEDVPLPFTSSDPPEELDELDIILEVVAPNLTFLQYKNLCREVVESFSNSDSDYYGNSTNYVGKKCCLGKLYKALVQRNMMS